MWVKRPQSTQRPTLMQHEQRCKPVAWLWHISWLQRMLLAGLEIRVWPCISTPPTHARLVACMIFSMNYIISPCMVVAHGPTSAHVAGWTRSWHKAVRTSPPACIASEAHGTCARISGTAAFGLLLHSTCTLHLPYARQSERP